MLGQWIGTNCIYFHVICCLVDMKTKKNHGIIICFKTWLAISPHLLFCALWFWYFSFLDNNLTMIMNKKCIILEDMKYSQPHINLYCAYIFCSWGVIMLRRVESLTIILFYSSSSSLSTPFSVVINMLLWRSWKDTCNNNFETIFFRVTTNRNFKAIICYWGFNNLRMMYNIII